MRAQERHYERLHPRVRASTRVDWKVKGGSTHLVSTLGNVSAGGMMVMTGFPAPVGAQVDLCLLTDVGPIPARALVTWSGEGGMGLRFEG